MFITMFKAKLHRACVTEADLNYIGSITIDKNLLDESGILPNEKVQVVNINTGHRFETYTLAGEKDSGTICLNGAASRLVQPGDRVIIIAYAQLKEEEAKNHKPEVLILDENNKILDKFKS